MRNILLSEREGYGGWLQLVDNDTSSPKLVTMTPIPQSCDEILEKPCPMMLVVFKILGLTGIKVGIFCDFVFFKSHYIILGVMGGLLAPSCSLHSGFMPWNSTQLVIRSPILSDHIIANMIN